MKKRLLAFMLVLAMVLSVLPASVIAETAVTHDNVHTCQDEGCKAASITWKPWTGTEKSGHYYLTGDVKLSATVSLANGNDLHLCLSGYSISGKNAVRLFSVSAGAKLSVSDCTTQLDENGKFVSGGGLVDGYHASVGGAGIYNNGGTLVLSGIQMRGHSCGCTSADGWAGSAIHVRGAGTVTVKNCYFTDNTGIEGSAITMRQDSSATVSDTLFHKNTATGNGGAIFVTAGHSTEGKGAKLTVTNSTFTENSAAKGGAAYVCKSAAQKGMPEVTFTGCSFTQNEASTGGAAVRTVGTTVTFDGCTMTGNTISKNGGSAIHTSGVSNVTIKDTSITGNQVVPNTNWGGAVYAENANDTITLQGKVVIDGNTVKNGTEERNVMLISNGGKLTVGTMTAGSSVTVLTENYNEGKSFTYTSASQLVAVAEGADLTGWEQGFLFYEDNENYVFYDALAKKLAFTGNPVHYHCLCGDGTDSNCDHSNVIWQPWGHDEAEKGKLPTDSGSYYLVEDVTLTQNANLSSNDNIRICLHGKTVKVDYATEGQVQDVVYYMTRNGKLTLSDCTAQVTDGMYTAGKLTGGSKGVLSMNKLGDGATENTLVIYDGILTGNTNTTDGGAINMTAGSGTFAMYGGEISGNTATGLGGAINAAKGSTINIYGGTIRNNTAGKNGAIAVVEAALNIHGGVITGNTGGNGAALYLNAAQVKITGGEIFKNTALTAGGVAAISNGSTVEISGGQFLDNTAPNGAGLCIMSNSNVIVSGGKFAGNAVTANGAALYVSRSGHLTVSGGEITGNTAAVHGGGIFVDYDGLLTITGGSITGNTAGTTGGGVSIHQNVASLTVSGKPVIAGNTVGTSTDNLHLRGEFTMQVGTMEAGASVGITADSLPRFISTQVTGDPVEAFFCDQAYREIVLKEEKLYMDFSGEHQHCLCGDGADKNCTHENVRWAAWEATDALPTESGSYYLLNDVVLKDAATLRTGADVQLCLNGHTVRADHPEELKENDRVFILRNDAKLTLSDCTAKITDGVYTAGKLTGGTMAGVILHGNASATFNMYDGIIAGNSRSDNVGGGVILRETIGKNVFNMYGGEISNNWAEGNGGAMYVKENCVFNMYGGTIRNNKSANFHGGAIAVVKDGIMNMYGGAITGNTASKNGGGIFVQEGILNIKGGQISGNTAGSNGGGISAITAQVNISGGSVSRNSAKAAAGALSVSTKSTVKISGGNLDYNKAKDAGSICIMSNSVVYLSGGSVGYNTAEANAGGIYVSKTGTLSMSGGSVHHNSCPRNGGGVFLGSAQFNFSGGDISYNTTETASGGLLVGSNSVVKMTGGNIRGNTSVRGAGMVVQGKSTFEFNGGMFQGNVAEVEGGGMYISPNCTFVMNGGEICENEAAYRGGGMLTNCSITINDGIIRANKVTGSEKYPNPYAGGVVMIGENNKTFTITGGQFIDNYSAGTGGGLRINYLNTLEMTGGIFKNNEAAKTAGGLEVYGYANVSNVQFIGNKAGTVGGGLRIMAQVQLNLENVHFEGNTAETRGGALYLAKGSWSTLKNCTITGNHSKEQGSAIYSWDELLLDGCTITGNTSGGMGAVYLCSANYDGQSYVLAVPKIAGDLVITGNEGPSAGLYFEDGAVAAVASQGLGTKANVEVYLTSGVLTNTLFGSYNYEGGEGVYTVTYGDRSENEYEDFELPEGEKTEAPNVEEKANTDWLLYAGVGVFALAVIAVVILLLRRKKQPAKKN